MPLALHDPKRDRIARDIASGANRSLVCQLHGLTPRGLTELLRTKDMERRIEAESEMIAKARALTEQRLLLAMPFAAENVLQQIYAADGSKECVDNSWRLLDRHKPQQESSGTLNLQLPEDLVISLRNNLVQIRHMREQIPDEMPELLEGEAALPRAAVVEAERELSESVGMPPAPPKPNGSDAAE